MSTDNLAKGRERGVSALEVLIVAASAVVLMAVTFVGVSQARRNSRRINATRESQNHLELARPAPSATL